MSGKRSYAGEEDGSKRVARPMEIMKQVIERDSDEYLHVCAAILLDHEENFIEERIIFITHDLTLLEFVQAEMEVVLQRWFRELPNLSFVEILKYKLVRRSQLADSLRGHALNTYFDQGINRPIVEIPEPELNYYASAEGKPLLV